MHSMLSSIFMAGLCLAMSPGAQAADGMIIWPAGWEVESIPQEPAKTAPPRLDTPRPAESAVASPPTDKPLIQLRQRALKNDANGNPAMVMELTQSRLQQGHKVNVEGVLLAMRKAVQVNFVRTGFQSVCTKMKDTTLSSFAAMETTCTITQNGVHMMTQTLVAAASEDTAWSLSYAGSAQGYADNKDEVAGIRESLRLNVSP